MSGVELTTGSVSREYQIVFPRDISRIETIDEMKLPFDRRIAIDHCISDKGAIWGLRCASHHCLSASVRTDYATDGVAA
jgi:hypothetical protein